VTVEEYKRMQSSALKQSQSQTRAVEESFVEYLPVSPVPIFDTDSPMDDLMPDYLPLADDYDHLEFPANDAGAQFHQLMAEMSVAHSLGGDTSIGSGDDNNDMDIDDDIVHAADLTFSGRTRTKTNSQQTNGGSQKQLFEINPLARQAELMMNIFSRTSVGNFISRKFLRDVYAKAAPENRPRIYNQNETSTVGEDDTITKKPAKKSLQTIEPIILKFATGTDLLDEICPNLSKAVICKRVQEVNSITRRQKVMVSKQGLLRSFWKPKISFLLFADRYNPQSQTIESMPELDDNTIERTIMNNDDSYDDVGFDGIMDLSLDGSVAGTGLLHTGITAGFQVPDKLPRYVTDFGENIDPFGLGDQNREFGLGPRGSNDLVPVEDKALEYTTKMKKVNIKKLKKIMFAYCEKESWVSVCVLLNSLDNPSNSFVSSFRKRRTSTSIEKRTTARIPEMA